MQNIPIINLGLVAVSRDCFPIELSRKRQKEVLKECQIKNIPVTEIEAIVETEKDVIRVMAELKQKRVNALVLFLGNFGPEGPATLLAQKFNGPTMLVGAAEEKGDDLIQGRGDAFCGLLSASFNMGLRRQKPFIPESPIGDAHTTADNLADFISIARIVEGVRNLKIFSFGPRPFDFITCHAPLQPLYDLGIEVMENSELDLFDLVKSQESNPRIKEVAAEMKEELGKGNTYPDLIPKLAQYEVALQTFFEDNLGVSQFGAFANKCWPAFEKFFGHVPCYVNSRLASRGIPVACEADIYGALSEYMAACASQLPPTLLDLNNTVPKDMVEAYKEGIGDYKVDDLWMGFHCGNTATSCMVTPQLKHQLIMHRLMEPGKEADITRGTLEGQLKAGPVSIFRLQSTPETVLKAYIAEGEILDLDPKSFGSIGIFAIKEMQRFYRHVLLEKRFPHHTAVAFNHAGKYLFPALKMLGVEDISFNLPVGYYYRSENPFK
jgi:L-fucose isomerase-like protein